MVYGLTKSSSILPSTTWLRRILNKLFPLLTMLVPVIQRVCHVLGARRGDGRFVICIYEEIDDILLLPVTAYEVPRPGESF